MHNVRRGEAKRSGQELSKTAQSHSALLESLSLVQQSHGTSVSLAGDDTPPEALRWGQAETAMWALLKLNWTLPDLALPGLSSEDPCIREEDAALCHKIVRSLFFENLGYREGAIAPAYAKTLGINISTIYYSGDTTGATNQAAYAADLKTLVTGTGIALVAPTAATIDSSFASFCASMGSAVKMVK